MLVELMDSLLTSEAAVARTLCDSVWWTSTVTRRLEGSWGSMVVGSIGSRNVGGPLEEPHIQ